MKEYKEFIWPSIGASVWGLTWFMSGLWWLFPVVAVGLIIAVKAID